MNNSTSVGTDVPFEREHMTKNMSLIAGYYMLVVCTLGVFENLLVFNTFRRNKNLRFVNTYMVKMLCVYDTAMATCAFPFILVSCIYNKWIFSDVGCQWYGFSMTFISMGSVSALTCIAFERFVIITCALKDSPKRLNVPMKIAAIVCTCMGLVLGLLPFFGIGTYQHEPVFLSCSPAWANKSKEDFIFVMLLFTCAFLLPVAIITFSYVGICIKVFTASTGQQRRNKHIQLLLISTLMIASFLLSWTPYAVFAFLQTFSAGLELTAMENMVPVMVAKSCILWNPLICVGGSHEVRNALKKDLNAMFSCISNICIIKCHLNSETNSKNTEHRETSNTDFPTRNNTIETSGTNQKIETIF